ncbi:oxidoreductase C-terminal domain-containing protein [Streptomyces sp. NPDC056061]|uniref:oxidoreductase C-terminal domain-containing protein n=1 Tax=Streptomyces sp. NPDC056061 TaxID=3345700 RepID=UPI0035E3ACC6
MLGVHATATEPRTGRAATARCAEPGGHDDVGARGDLTSREFIAFWFAVDRVPAGMDVSIWDVDDAVRRLVRSGSTVERAALADSDVPLDKFTSA